jgi:hypothetical protein
VSGLDLAGTPLVKHDFGIKLLVEQAQDIALGICGIGGVAGVRQGDVQGFRFADVFDYSVDGESGFRVVEADGGHEVIFEEDPGFDVMGFAPDDKIVVEIDIVEVLETLNDSYSHSTRGGAGPEVPVAGQGAVFIEVEGRITSREQIFKGCE